MTANLFRAELTVVYARNRWVTRAMTAKMNRVFTSVYQGYHSGFAHRATLVVLMSLSMTQRMDGNKSLSPN